MTKTFKNNNMAAYQMICLVVILSQFLLQGVKVNGSVSSLVVFGDSTVDSGNNNFIPTVLKSNFQPYGRDFENGQSTGRFSNGRIVTDFLSEAFGMKSTVPAYLDPAYNISDFAKGVCFASAGTGYDNVTSSVLTVIPLWKQLEYYKEYLGQLKGFLGDKEAETTINEALHIISLGANDFLENYYVLPITSSRYSIEDYQNFLVTIAENFINNLYQLGAQRISLIGIGPIGCLPLERNKDVLQGGSCVESYNNVARTFNQKLQGLVDKLNTKLFKIQIVFTNPYEIFSKIIQDPFAYGFENAARACCGTGRFEMSYMCDRFNPFTCRDANKYVFWDSFHPTEKAYGMLAHHAVINSLAVFL